MSDPLWLRIVTARARLRTLWCREFWSYRREPGEQALAITHSEVDRALLDPDEIRARERAFLAAEPEAVAITRELEACEAQPPDPAWAALLDTCGLSDPEAALLSCALAAELRPSLRRVFGYLQDEPAALEASPALVGGLWQLPAPPVIGIGSQLVEWRLARPLELGQEPASSAAGWVADPALLAHLLPGGPQAAATLARALHAPPGPVLRRELLGEIVNFVASLGRPSGQDGKGEPRGRGPAPALEVELIGPAGCGRASIAAQAASALGLALLAVDASALARLPDPLTVAIRELRSARLAHAAILLEHAEALPAGVLPVLAGRAQLLFLTAAAPLPAPDAAGPLRRSYVLEPLDRGLRIELWSALASAPVPAPVSDWALRPGEVVAATRAATAGPDSIREICRRLVFEAPSELARPLPLPYGWDDLVVSGQLLAHLREFEAQASARSEVLDGWGLARLAPLGRGVSAMFAGPSGTGKTMAAQVLARALGLELLRVDLAGVVNKYIGETEKHLRAVFAACERAPVMLFFDEADALFGRRMQVSDAHDRFANIEVDYLLQRMEEFDGVAVLATNRKGDIDSAFLRRLRFVIDFAPPTVSERERLWRLALERAADRGGRQLTETLEFAALARDLDLTGAGIKASALAAAFLARSEGAPIGQRHVIAAARRELHKRGVVVRAGPLDGAGQPVRLERVSAGGAG